MQMYGDKLNGVCLGLTIEAGSEYKCALGFFSAQWKCSKIKLE